MSNPVHVRKPIFRDERGMAMIITVLALMVLLVLGIGLLQNSVASVRVAGNDRTTKAALTIAIAGAEEARETLRVQAKAGQTLSQELTTAANGSTLVNATRVASGHNTDALYRSDSPLSCAPPTTAHPRESGGPGTHNGRRVSPGFPLARE